MKLKGAGDVKKSIQNGKVFELAWPDPVGPNPAATKAMLQAEYRTRANRLKKNLHQPEHGIWPSTPAVHKLPAAADQGAEEMGDDIQLEEPDQSTEKN